MKQRLRPLLLLLAALLAPLAPARSQTTVKKVVLQGFWWDYTNGNFRNRWADYLTELAPRLQSLGIDAVWIPPTVKNNGGTNGVGYAPQQDWMYNLKYLAGFASGGETMLNTGEFVGSKQELDAYTTAINSRNGGTDFGMGTFDFSLRGAIYGMVASGGNYDLSQVPAAQQNQRVAYYPASNTYVHRTAPFVNSHDSFRPRLSATGNYTGWNSSQELVAHIEPGDPRLAPAYAIALAVDGSPYVFIEDLFDLNNGQRFAHLPANAAALPVRPDLANLLWCHQHLNFKAGAYFVRWQAPDHLVIERGGRALIGINDNFTTWQNNTVASSFAPGTVLKDYSGANGTATVTVGPGGQVAVNTPPCNGTALLGRRGYSVWAPVGQDNNPYAPARAPRTTQEWELADDLGDRNCRSLGQGGALPANATAWRTAGKIFAQASTPVEYLLYPGRTPATDALVVALFDANGALLGSQTGPGNLSGTFTPAADGWLTLKARNATATQAGQRAFVQARYQAPTTVNTRLPANSPAPRRAIWSAAAGTTDALDCRNYEAGFLPTGTRDLLIPANVTPAPVLPAGAFLAAARLTVEAGTSLTVARTATVQLFGDLTANGTLAGDGTWRFTSLSRAPQRIGGAAPLSLARVVIANDSADVALATPLTVRDTLVLSNGRLALGPHNLTVGPVVEGGSTASYVLTDGPAAAGGFCLRASQTNGSVLYPVGTASGYAPFTYTHQGMFGSPLYGVRVVDGVLANATSGPAFGPAARFVNYTWLLSTGAAPNCCGSGTLALGWAAAAENPSFDRSQSALYSYDTSTGWTRRSSAAVPATGGGPFGASFAAITPSYLALAVGNFTALGTRARSGPALLAVFPNPSAGAVQLVAASASAPVQPLALRLTNALGQTVFTAPAAPLPTGQGRLNASLATAAPGVYLLTVQAPNGTTQHLRLVRE